MNLSVSFSGGKVVNADKPLSPQQVLGLEFGFSVYGLPYRERLGAAAVGDVITLSIPSRPKATSVGILSSADVLSGQHFSLEDMLCPFVSEEKAPALYEYQHTGSDWLTRNRAAILADDMGLGKTVQAINAFSQLVLTRKAHFGLVICTKSLVLNWLSEFQAWTPWLAVTPLIASSSGGKEIWVRQCRKAHVIVTTYDQLRIYGDRMSDQCNVVILDEAHRLKNLGSARTQSFRKINREYTWMLTGTPIERDQQDLLNLMTILKPQRFSSGDAGMLAPTLRELAKPLILRRKKDEVLGQLPEMVDVIEKIPLSGAQSRSYRALVMQQPTNYLARFSKLRELCDIDSISGESSKLDRIEELVITIKNNNEKVVIFSYWMRPLEALKERLQKIRNLRMSVVDSSLNIVQRNSIIDEFKTTGDCLLISGHIGAEGLNLTEANHVIFINRWWNPSSIGQAKDRVRRIGQKKVSFSYSFVAPGTLEDDISQLISKKQLTFNEIVEGVRGSLYRPR